MPTDSILYTVGEGVATITLNRPDKLNSLDAALLRELFHAILAVDSDPSVRCIILTGAGEKAFVAGADINELAQQNPVNGKEFSLYGQSVFHLLETIGKPSICAINGFALGG